jgi:hypothetical protein
MIEVQCDAAIVLVRVVKQHRDLAYANSVAEWLLVFVSPAHVEASVELYVCVCVGVRCDGRLITDPTYIYTPHVTHFSTSHTHTRQ